MRLRRMRIVTVLVGAIVALGLVRFYIAHSHPQSERQHIKHDHHLVRKEHNRHGAAVSVGFCALGIQEDGLDSEKLDNSAVADKKMVEAIVAPALRNKWIQWRNMTEEGLPIGQEPYPDLSFCFSGKFSPKAIETRFDHPPELGAPPNIRSEDMDTWRDGVYRPDDMGFVRHNRGRPLLVGLNEDPWETGDCSHLDLIFDVKTAHPFYGCPSIYIPPALLQLLPTPYDASKTLTRRGIQGRKAPSKRKFCVLYCDPCNPQPMSGDGVIAWAFLNILREEYQDCDIKGDCQKSAESVMKCSSGQRKHSFLSALDTFSDYRFVIAFETAQVDGYMSSTAIVAAMAGALPIFWGDESVGAKVDVEEGDGADGDWVDGGEEGTRKTGRKMDVHSHDLNEKRLFNMNDYVAEEHVLKLRDAEDMQGDHRVVFAENFLRGDMKKAVEKIRELNEAPEKYTQVVSQPLITGEDAEESFFHPLRISRSFRIVLEDLESFAA